MTDFTEIAAMVLSAVAALITGLLADVFNGR